MRVNALLLALSVSAALRKAVQDPDSEDAQDAVNAVNAESAAHVAVQAAKVSNQVATHSAAMNGHAQEALKHAQEALKTARTDTEGLSESQQESLKKADTELQAATAKLETEELAQTEWVTETLADADAEAESHATTDKLSAHLEELNAKISQEQEAQQKAALEAELEAVRKQLEEQKTAEKRNAGYLESIGKMKDEVTKMKSHIDTMEDIKKLRANIGDTVESNDEEEALRKELSELQDLLKGLDEEHEAGATVTPAAEDSLREELAHLRKSIAESIKRQEEAMQAKSTAKVSDFAPLNGETAAGVQPPPAHGFAPKSSGSGGLDIDTEMPYGELEPFGREDTAAELTDASIRESDKMVDTIEKAEVAEEKRSVFRALTRLRGAAITSYDGVARSQTGNIDEYNHVHKWRETHPLHHLADEESDVSKWAFPDNAD